MIYYMAPFPIAIPLLVSYLIFRISTKRYIKVSAVTLVSETIVRTSELPSTPSSNADSLHYCDDKGLKCPRL